MKVPKEVGRNRISFEDANNFRSKVWDAYKSTVVAA